MKKGLIIFGLCFLLVMSFVSAQSNETSSNESSMICTDSDGGKNIYTQGTTSGQEWGTGQYVWNAQNEKVWVEAKAITSTDYCVTEGEKVGRLVEYSCSGNLVASESFDCSCQNGACVNGTAEATEKVTCKFVNSNDEQKCYTTLGSITNADRYNTNNFNLGTFSCSGKGSCTVEISGNKERNEKVTWKSSCGGYAYTTLDGNDESISFDCNPQIVPPISEVEIPNKYYNLAYWQCYNGEEQKEEGCKSLETWEKIAKSFCDGKCYDKTEKCGLDSFSILESSQCSTTEVTSEVNTTQVTTTEENFTFEDKILICKDSCPLEGKCYSFGYRKSGEFCSDTGSFIKQTKDNEKCDNNFECSSNVCVNSNCVSGSLIESIINWFKKLFGGE